MSTRKSKGRRAFSAGRGSTYTGGFAPAGTLPNMPLPAAGLVRLRTIGTAPVVFVAEITSRPIAAGGGGHETVAVPAGEALVSYAGRSPLSMPLELLLDRWTARASVEPDIRALEQLVGMDDVPPPVIIEGIGIPHSYQREPGRRWVLSAPEWGEERGGRRDGSRTYQALTVTAMAYTRPDPDALTAAMTRAHHTIRKGSELLTLSRIARHYKTSWTRLRELNPKLPADPDVQLKAGTRVRLS